MHGEGNINALTRISEQNGELKDGVIEIRFK